jgi:hypothetical protein
MKPAETAVAKESLCKHFLARQWLCSLYVIAATDRHTKIELLETVFSVQSVQRLHKKDQSREKWRESAGSQSIEK